MAGQRPAPRGRHSESGQPGAQRRVLLTEDKDFGQLVYASGEGAAGVLLIRFPGPLRATLPAAVLDLVERFGERLSTSFIVLEPGRVRIGSMQPDQGSG